MSDVQKRPYGTVFPIARRIVSTLAPHCERIELAGSRLSRYNMFVTRTVTGALFVSSADGSSTIDCWAQRPLASAPAVRVTPTARKAKGRFAMSKEKVQWKRVPGFPQYRVNTKGRVQSRKSGQWKDIGALTGSGYRSVSLRADGKKKNYLVHRLVLKVFVGPCPDGMEACHKNGDRTDNRLENLCWGTPERNWRDRKRHGRTAARQGSETHWAKLDEDKVRKIKVLYAEGESGKNLAKQFNVSPATISMIVNGHTWRHV